MEREPETVGTSEEDDVPTTPTKVDFPCENCGADMTWDPSVDALSCEYCGNVVEVPRGEGTIVERGLEEAGKAARGFGVELRVAHCSNCGARVTFEESSTSELCVYCGDASVLPQEANRNALRPESLVPLDVGRDEVRQSFERWLKGLWFRPNQLKKTKRFDAVGVYVPFWTFDCRVHSDWSAHAGYYYYVNQSYVVMVNGRPQTRTRRVRKIRWVPAWGERDDVYDDHLVLASRGLPPDLMRKLGDFDTSGLVPYRPEYLAGWRAEEYRLDLDGGWELGQQHVAEEQERRCAGDVPGDTYRALRVANRIWDVRWKHVLLPVWSLQYRFKKTTYTVLVHGQTGRVVGEAPLSWPKILGLVAAVAVVGLVAFLIASAG
jgi:predicted RNA-binding Zn-ribbon protein involved in translation (DUF1610 family)